MKRVSIKVLSIMIFLFLIFFNVINVFGYTDYKPGSKGSSAHCTWGACFSGTVGFRLTIVTEDTGERCKYNPSTNTMCLTKQELAKLSASEKKKLIESKSYDFWYDIDQVLTTKSSNCYTYSKNNTKQEFVSLNNKQKGKWTSCSNKFSGNNDALFGITLLGLPSYNSTSYRSEWKKLGGEYDVQRNPMNQEIILDYVKCQAGDIKKCKSRNGSTIKNSNGVLNKMLNASFYGISVSGNKASIPNKINISDVYGLNNARIQFEQLLQIENYLLSNKGPKKTSIITMGTVAEASYIYQNENNTAKKGISYDACDASYYKPPYGMGGCIPMSFGSYLGYFTGFYGDKIGILSGYSGFDNDLKCISTSGEIQYTKKKCDNYKKYIRYYSLPIFYQKNSANVYSYWLKGKGKKEKPCEDLATNKSLNTNSINTYVSGLKNLIQSNGGTWDESKYGWMNNASYYGIKDAKKLQNFIKSTNSCLEPECEDLYTKVYDSNYNTFKSKVPIYADSTQKNLIKNYSDARWNYVIHDAISSFKITSANVCKATRCSDILVNQELNTKKYNQLESDKKKIINIMNTNKSLYADFNYKYLNEDILKIFNVKAACDGKLPDCKNIDNISKCESPYNISIGKKSENDATYKKECILNGFLYNIGNKFYRSVNNKYTGYLDQSSLYTVYCSEKIDIEMPKINSSYTKAGRVFQWGKNIKTETNTGADSDTKNFATMTVVQQCYKGSKIPNGTSRSFSSNEIKKFKQLNDSLSTSNGQISSTTMDFTYKEPTGKFKFNNLSYDRKLVSRKVAPSSSVIEITSVYDFDYSRKMTWYSHKGNSEEDMIDKNDYNNLSNIQKNEYLFIGYGAPTSFNTADGTYKESITATIKNIGVSGEYKHLYSSDILEYKCDFKIHNEIIGNECCDVSTGKPFPGAPSYCTCDGGKEPKGLDVAFRTIQLVNKNASSSSINSEINKAFPGRTGAGRNLTGNIGKNWKTLIDSDTKTVLNILRDDIYSGAPQYTISLDVRKISAIRESNKALRAKSIDPYTYRGKVKNGTGYTCYENGKYGYCRSEFVKEYLNGKCATRTGASEKKPCE